MDVFSRRPQGGDACVARVTRMVTRGLREAGLRSAMGSRRPGKCLSDPGSAPENAGRYEISKLAPRLSRCRPEERREDDEVWPRGDRGDDDDVCPRDGRGDDDDASPRAGRAALRPPSLGTVRAALRSMPFGAGRSASRSMPFGAEGFALRFIGVIVSSTADSSAGSGALTWNGTPEPGHSNATDWACRNVRFKPNCFSSALRSRSPYLLSPSRGWPRTRRGRGSDGCGRWECRPP